jgi:hypothetical protein
MNEGLNTLKTEGHLIKGIRPIMACVGSFDDFHNSGQKPLEEVFNEQLDNAHCVDYRGSIDYFKKRNFLNAGSETYVLSVVDNKNKFSERFFDCTGLIVTGIDKKTGKNISFLSHQDPVQFLHNKKDDFIKHLGQRLAEIKKRCISGTIDAIIVGGNYINITDDKGLHHKEKYVNSVELLSTEIKKILNFEPIVVNGPKKIGGKDNIYYDNDNRRLYFVRERVNEDTGSFTNSNIEEEKKKWEKDTKRKPW